MTSTLVVSELGQRGFSTPYPMAKPLRFLVKLSHVQKWIDLGSTCHDGFFSIWLSKGVLKYLEVFLTGITLWGISWEDLSRLVIE
jgi:hypothetical protein